MYQVFFDRRRAELSRAEPQRIMRERRRQMAGASRSSRHLPGRAGAVLPRRPTVVEAVALPRATSLHARSDALPGVQIGTACVGGRGLAWSRFIKGPKDYQQQQQQRTTRYTGPPTDRASAARGPNHNNNNK